MKAPPPRSDRLVLSALLISKKLSTSEEKAFKSMLESLDGGQIKLSPNQRLWADQVYEKLKLDKNPDPIVMIKSKTAKAAERQSSHPFDDIMKNRPLKPPGR